MRRDIRPPHRSAVRFPAWGEQQGDAPDARKGDDGVDDPCPDRSGAAEDPRDEIELEQPDAAPVERADDRQHQRDLVHDAVHG